MLSSFETATTLVKSLYKQDIRHAVLSPGSRSTPLTLALAYHNGFSRQVVLDERSAAFIALGIGKETGKPAVLVCTSGTAAANYFPAVVEAKQSGVPMIVLTADRPPKLRGIGSSQSIDQIKLYGDYAVFFHEMGEPADDINDIKRIQFAAHQAVTDAIHKGGASHLNIPFRKPFEPPAEIADLIQKKNNQQISSFSAVKSTSLRRVTPSDEIVNLINHSKRPLIIGGPSNRHHSNAESALQIAEIISAPVLSEPGSRFDLHSSRIYRFDQFLRNKTIRTSLKPDLILRFGDQPFNKSLLNALQEWSEVHTIRFAARTSWQDNHMNSHWNIDLSQSDIFETDPIKPKNKNFLHDWLQEERKADLLLKNELDNKDQLCDGHIFHHISTSFPDSWQLILSNSLPVRDSVLFGNPGKQTIVNRGAAGIDGVLSTAIGSSLATGSATCCVIGDLAFLHDSNALLSLKNITSPFVIVVINNNGGNIFRMLPIYEHQETYRTYFETPQNTDFKYIARAYSLNYQRIESIRQLDSFSFTDHKKPILIECITNSDKSMIMRKKLWDR